MADLRALVSDLIHLGDGPPIVTLYLDTHWRDEQQRNRVRVFFNDEVRTAKKLFSERPEWKGLDETFRRLGDRIEEIVNQDVHESSRSVAFVASHDRGLYLEAWLGDHVETAMYVDAVPRVFPLIELLSLQRPVFLVSVESPGAEILEWRLGEVVDEHVLRRDIPNRHSMGGWSQRKFQRNTDRIIQGVWKDCVDLLARVGANPKTDIILFGTEENLRGFERLLPRALESRIIGLRPLPVERRRLLDVAREVCDEELIAREFALVHRILRMGLSDRTGIVGLDDVLTALDERQVRTLAMSRRFNPPGFECTVCRALWRTGATGCVFCGGKTTSLLLREPISRRCLADGGELVVVSDGGPLDAYHGVGCLLRHLSGQERRQPASTGVSIAAS